MNKELLKNYLIREQYEKYHHLVEYTNAGGAHALSEAGDDQDGIQQEPNMGGGSPDMMGGGDMQQDSMGGGSPDMMGGDMGGDMSGDPNMMGGGDMQQDSMGGGNAQPPQGFNPEGENETLGDTSETDPNEEEEEVIDVDDLTHSQEETERKIDAMAEKFDSLMDMLNGFEKKINSNDEKFDMLKNEIEKRNPTPVEKMTLRSKNSYPFNQTPEEYWDDKEATSNYSPDADNNGVDMPEYQITKDDIDNIADWRSIYKTMDDDFNPLRDLIDF